MEMCYDGTLVMPNSYAVMSEEEMTYVEGGWTYKYSKSNIAVPIKRMYASKIVCQSFGAHMVAKHGKRGFCNGMTALRIAQELYAHALAYFFTSALTALKIKPSIIREIKACAKTADIGLGDGLDGCYSLIWWGSVSPL